MVSIFIAQHLECDFDKKKTRLARILSYYVWRINSWQYHTGRRQCDFRSLLILCRMTLKTSCRLKRVKRGWLQRTKL